MADYQAQAAAAGNSAAASTSTRRLRVGVIGLGIGRMHIEGWRQHPDVDVVAITDADPARLATVGEQFGIAARYTGAAEMLAAEQLDVVSICTPNKFHKELTLAAFAAGCHVLCEKPMAMNADEGREMLAAARRAGKRLMINFSYRFSAQSRALKAQVDTGQFGEFYFGRTVWHRRRGMPGFGGWFGQKALAGGGPLIDLGVHRLDLALWLMGYPKPTWVLGNTYDPIAREAAKASGKAFDVEDLAAAFIRFENGATLVLEASWAAHIQEAELMETRLLGTKAGLLQKNLNEGYQFDAHIFSDSAGAQIDTHVHPPTTPPKSAMHDYAEAILAEQPHPAPGEEGLIVMEILDAVYESARTGAPVQLGGR
jgi:predicted dehydrogenase